ncbi:hypothetical protein AB0M20_38055, partial [Actinoplanes sp. NPDC051633]
MARGLRYADAVKLLGGQTPEIKALDNLLGGALAVATGGGSDLALGLFDAKAEVIRLGHVLTDRLHERLRGLGRFDRTMRLEAAHGVLVVTAFFEAVDDITLAAGLRDTELTREEQITLAAGGSTAGDWLHRMLNLPLPVPSADRTRAELRTLISDWYLGTAHNFRRFLEGLSLWEDASADVRRQVSHSFDDRVAAIGTRRFEEAHLRLAVEIPEFALWTERLDTTARHRELRHSLGELGAFLRRTSQGSDPERHRAELALAYQADLHEPVAGDAGDRTLPAPAQGDMDPPERGTPAAPAE